MIHGPDVPPAAFAMIMVPVVVEPVLTANQIVQVPGAVKVVVLASWLVGPEGNRTPFVTICGTLIGVSRTSASPSRDVQSDAVPPPLSVMFALSVPSHQLLMVPKSAGTMAAAAPVVKFYVVSSAIPA